MRISHDTFLSVPFLKVAFLFLCITSSATRGIGAVRRLHCGTVEGGRGDVGQVAHGCGRRSMSTLPQRFTLSGTQ
jgi:hypothetical protein